VDQDASCSFCDQPAVAACKRCNRPYCVAHGGPICAHCLDPVSAAPSGRPFLFALAAFPICVLLAGWFLVTTPRLPGVAAGNVEPVTSGSPADSSSAAAAVPTATPVARDRTLSPSATATPATRDYTVKDGDTLQSIASEAGVSVPALTALNPNVDPTALQIGQVVHLPAKTQ
jgi:hypothetical protein